MLFLQLLGGLSLLNESGPLAGPATQRRRLALLARLAAAPNRTVSRDKLVACFWPEEDRERARHFLADSVFTLRRGLGKEIVRSVGDDLVLDSDSVTCDLWQFDEALRQDALEDGVSLYRGPFLDGFFIGDAPEFERWVEEERSALARRFAGAVERLAEELERRGEAANAARWWGRLAAHDPFSSRVSLRLMRSLAASGDRVAAVQHARVHAALLREEFGMEADAQVQALAEELALPPTSIASGRAISPPSADSSAPGEPAEPADTPKSEVATGAIARADRSAPPLGSTEAAAAAPGASSSADRTTGSARSAAAATTRGGLRLPANRLRSVRRSLPLLLPLLVAGLLLSTAMWGSGHLRGRAAVRTAEGARAAAATIAVLPFSYQGVPDHAYLAEGLVTLLSASLDGAGELRTVDPYALLGHTLSSRETEAMPLQEAGEIAADLGADLFLLGTAVASGDRLHLSVTLYRHAPQPLPLRRASAEGSDVAALVDELCRQLLIGELAGPPDRLMRLAVRTTTSLPALKAFLQGEREFRAARYPRAAESLQQAVREDPAFALAHYRLSMALEWSFDFREARRAAREALRLSEPLSVRDQQLIGAWHSFVNGDAERAERLYNDVLVDDPFDVEAWSGIGEVWVHYNAARGRPTTEAIPAFERVLALAPNFGEARFHLLEFAAREGDRARFDSLLAGVDRQSPHLLSWEAARSLAWVGPDLPDSLRARLEEAEDVIVGVAAIRAGVHFRELESAQALAALLTRTDRPEDWRAAGWIMSAQGHLARGDHAAARRALELAAPVEPAWALEMNALAALLPEATVTTEELRLLRDQLEAWNPRALDPGATFFFAAHADVHAQLRSYLLALLSLRLGDDDSARRYGEQLRSTDGSPDTRELGRSLSLSVAAHRAWRDGDPARVERLLDEGRMRAPLERTALSPFFAQALDRFLRAEALSALGRREEALRWYGSLTDAPDLLWWRAAHRRQSELLRVLGRAEQARWHQARWEGM